MFRLPDNASIGEYTIARFIKKGLLNDTYVIRDENGTPFFMKAFDLERIPDKMLVEGIVEEIWQCRRISHPNIIKYAADGILSRQDFRADEKAFQVLSQYRNLSPRFVVQTREAGHPVFRLMAKDVNPVEQMLTERSIAGYPPYSRLVRLQLKDTNANRLSMMSRDLSAIVANIGVRFEGPYAPVQDAESREIRVVLPRDRELVKRKAAMAQAITAFEQDRKYSGHIVIDVDPV